MIQIYKQNNTDFDKNGDSILFPKKAIVRPILNSVWTAEINHPIDTEDRWKFIVEGAVVKMPSFNGEQLFRIVQKEKLDSGVTATLQPIFMDAKDDCWLVDVRPTVKNGQEALNLMTAPNKKYTGRSNITTTATAYYQYMNLIECINSDEQNSFLNRWGGEILFDNYTIIVNKKIGGNYGVGVTYGKNIITDGLTEEIDTRDVVTRIYPKAYNGYTMSNNGYVDSPVINKYPTVKTKTITFPDVKMREDEQEDDVVNGVIICDTQAQLNTALKLRCNEQYAAGIDKPKVSMSADLALLQNTEEYRDYKVLELISLGDTVSCTHDKLGISTDARCVEFEYDSILEKVTHVELGDFKYNYFDNVSSMADRIDGAIRNDGTLAAEKISGIIDGMTAKLRAMKDIAQKQDVRAILFEDLDPNSPTFGAMALGTAGFEISDKRTADNRDWEWSTFGTAQGFYATYLIAGILSSRNWIEDSVGFKFDLDHGTINSKHLKLDNDGLLKLYSAVIEGGMFTVTYKDSYGINIPMFVVNENGIGIGSGGQILTYYAGDSFMTLASELRILAGRLTGYASNGQKGIEMDRTTLNFYSWNDAGNYVGCVRSFKKINSGRIGVELSCDKGDMLILGVSNGKNGTTTPLLEVDGADINNPISLYTGLNVKGASVFSGGIDKISGTVTANIPFVKNVTSTGAVTTGRLRYENGLLKGVE